ncbi:hypothetical protein N7G274_005846 [Stereocaulon virgatum]|uniref:Uncharacterized protein n=1 Tax=Stereocaulon virgatum TaxID=373712 RepID=A0ABR4A9P7_9LECA
MAEEPQPSQPDMSGSTTPIPPIDNIHNSINNEPEPLPLSTPHDPLPQQPHMLDQLDTEMPDMQSSYIPQQQPTITPNIPPQTQRTATPIRHVNGVAEVAPPMPSKAAAHGAPARRYLNEKVTGVLLEGLKRLAADQPENPLQVLGEFLLQRSKELEGTS